MPACLWHVHPPIAPSPTCTSLTWRSAPPSRSPSPALAPAFCPFLGRSPPLGYPLSLPCLLSSCVRHLSGSQRSEGRRSCAARCRGMTRAHVAALRVSGRLAPLTGRLRPNLTDASPNCGPWCYDSLVKQAFGPRVASLATVAILLNQLGSLVGFLVAIADWGAPTLATVLPAHLRSHLGVEDSSDALPAHLRSHLGVEDSSDALRAAVLGGLGLFVLWPLSLARSLHSLRFPSILSVLAVCR